MWRQLTYLSASLFPLSLQPSTTNTFILPVILCSEQTLYFKALTRSLGPVSLLSIADMIFIEVPNRSHHIVGGHKPAIPRVF